jgi:hypothetical protein
MKRFLLALLVLLLSNLVYAQEGQSQLRKWYVGTNPLAYAMPLPLKEELKRFGPVLTGNEYGFNAVGGYALSTRWQIEARLSLGSVHQVAFVGQIHWGIDYNMLYRQDQAENKGLYAGMFLKYWDFCNKLTRVHFHNVAPYLTTGYRWDVNRWLFDLRLNQTIAVHSWASLDDTKSGTAWFLSPWPELIRVIPTLSFTVGYKL